MVANISTPPCALSIQLSPWGPISTPARISPMMLGTLIRFSRRGASRTISSRMAKISTGLVNGNANSCCISVIKSVIGVPLWVRERDIKEQNTPVIRKSK
jgi:hypothetical protein